MAELAIYTTPLYAGTPWSITEDLADYPATLFDAKYILKRATDNPLSITATKTNTSHVFTKTAAQTLGLTGGNYNVQLLIYNLNGEVPVKIFEITKEIKVQLSSTSGDARSFSERMLDAIQSTSEGRATREQAEMQIPGGVNVKHLSPEEMIKWESFYSLRVKAEKRKKAGFSSNIHHKMKFT